MNITTEDKIVYELDEKLFTIKIVHDDHNKKSKMIQILDITKAEKYKQQMR